jgi:hypothetical protein
MLGFGAGLFAPRVATAADDRLPDGETASFGGYSGWLTGPTRRYKHAVLGDDIEASGFTVTRAGRVWRYELDNDAVFEDRRIRLVDINADGVPEVLVVKSTLTGGAALAIYRIDLDRITPLAQSAALGTPNRWLNPIGVDQFTGTGLSIAVVVTPHLAGSLRLYRVEGSKLIEITRIDGFTNHIIGSRDLDLARVVPSDDASPARILIPRLDRTSIALVSFAGGTLRIIKDYSLSSRVIAIAPPSSGFTRIRLSDGSTQSLNLMP